MTWSFLGVTVKLFIADLQNDIIQEPPISVRAYHSQTVAEFKKMVGEVNNLLTLDLSESVSF
jgi:hypothetical protein